ncbi:MAG: type II toxin-antitoxin system VapC family toxin [Chloroflexi bacterium]|nr:type II toxin-antitoxin system VapC family toxin [Chloroflexota bacterium]
MHRLPMSINERRVFVDTSGFLAYIDPNDRHYEEGGLAMDRLIKGRYRLFTTMYVVVESHAGLLRAISPTAGREFLVEGVNAVSLLPTPNEVEEQAKAVILQQRDKDYSLGDAISFVVMERLGLHLALAYDDHFRQRSFSTPLGRRDWPY